jgi:hypothetical protein
VAVSDNGSTVATGSIDNRIHVYDRQGTLLGESMTKNPVKSRSVAVSGDGSLIVAVDSTNVYGFSRSQFAAPANQSSVSPPAPEETVNTTLLPAQPNTTVATPVPPEAVPVVTTEPGTSPAGTTVPGFTFPFVLCALAILGIATGRLYR